MLNYKNKTNMKIKDFIKRFREELEIETEIDQNTEFRQLNEWSSLAGLTVIAMVDEEYGVTIKADEIRQAKTIQELFDLVSSKL